MTSRTRLLWPWIVATVVTAPVLYVASFGPACWITAGYFLGAPVKHPKIMMVYWPIGAIIFHGDPSIAIPIKWWMTFGLAKGECAFAPTDVTASRWFCVPKE